MTAEIKDFRGPSTSLYCLPTPLNPCCIQEMNHTAHLQTQAYYTFTLSHTCIYVQYLINKRINFFLRSIFVVPYRKINIPCDEFSPFSIFNHDQLSRDPFLAINFPDIPRMYTSNSSVVKAYLRTYTFFSYVLFARRRDVSFLMYVQLSKTSAISSISGSNGPIGVLCAAIDATNSFGI